MFCLFWSVMRQLTAATAVDKVGAAETDGVCLTVQQPPDLSGANEAKSPEVLLGNNLSRQGTESVSCNSHQFSTLQRVSRSNSQSGSDCENNKTSFRKEKIKSNPEKWHFSTLPRKTLAGKLNKDNKEDHSQSSAKPKAIIVAAGLIRGGAGPGLPKSKSQGTGLGAGQEGVPGPVLPPPPSFKSVHFDPALLSSSETGSPTIPTEGLPAGPAEFDSATGKDRCIYFFYNIFVLRLTTCFLFSQYISFI